ncbi:hypothetical protein EX30DRAFT_251797 [Ascodesmis nigricans]|uniref:Uncharacterized protein n=1 Tax=Ascodesmis nigricans TaxID=341454 RepID=A0A4S2MY21_9PEZI|nr:hypothetical protein EX30DRAFT_251797 [Ascodesmis nigricans]
MVPSLHSIAYLPTGWFPSPPRRISSSDVPFPRPPSSVLKPCPHVPLHADLTLSLYVTPPHPIAVLHCMVFWRFDVSNAASHQVS